MTAQPAGLFIVSGLHLRPLLEARKEGAPNAHVSLDLGLSTVEVPLERDGAVLPDGGRLAWSEIEAIRKQETACFTVASGQATKVQRFSATTNRALSLMATAGAPTIIIAGFTMHRIVGLDPQEDTRRKIAALGAPRGAVLDTCTGLGYTAIAAARTAERVVTVELDPATLEIAALNPWSRDLFATPRITQVLGDAAAIVAGYAPGSFSSIIHDPPTFSLAGDLYGGAFYRDLYRLLQPGGRLFHYIGQVEGKFSQSLSKGVIRRLQEAGFRQVERVPAAFGLVARS